MWVSYVSYARLSPLAPMCHTFTAQQERQRCCPVQATRPSLTPPHMLHCPLHAMPPAMQCYGVMVGTRTLAALDLRIRERHVTRGVICVPSLSHDWCVPRPTTPMWGQSTSCVGCGGFGMSPWICCSRLQLAAPTGRSPFTALPFPSLPFPSLSLNEGPLSRCFGPLFVFLHGGGLC